MATWTTVPDASLEPGKPIRSIDVLALRDNPVAITEGAAGAPRILDAALGSTVTTAGTNWVINRNAGAAVGDIGTYAFLGETSTTTTAPGGTRAGSVLRYAGVYSDVSWATTTVNVDGAGSTIAPSGTWRCMGRASNIFGSSYPATLWLRIA